MRFNAQEIQEIAVSVVAISVALQIAQRGLIGFLGLSIFESLYSFALIFFSIGIGFIFHELAHKFVAQKFGAIAYFKAWPSGLAFMLLFAVALGFVFAAPGAVMISAWNLSRRQVGLISLAGPLTNFALAVGFMGMQVLLLFSGLGGGVGEFLASVFLMGAFANAFLGLFNLLPIFPLDGAKVLAWDSSVWVALTAVLAAIVFLGFWNVYAFIGVA